MAWMLAFVSRVVRLISSDPDGRGLICRFLPSGGGAPIERRAVPFFIAANRDFVSAKKFVMADVASWDTNSRSELFLLFIVGN